MSTPRRLVAIAFAVLVAAGATGAHPAPAAAADLTISAAELEMVTLLNAERRRYGLRSVRVDPRLMTIARSRSTNMATHHYFSHVQPDGRNVFDYIRAARITWYGAGEIIAYNSRATWAESAVAARDGWMGSSAHRAIVLSRDYNYVGIGAALDTRTGRKLWTGVFMKGPDRTGAYASFGAVPAVSIPASVSNQYVLITWTGGDVLLQTLTAGFSHYRLRISVDGGTYTDWPSATTATSRWLRAYRGHRYDIQVRGCDKVGNCGRWAAIRIRA